MAHTAEHADGIQDNCIVVPLSGTLPDISVSRCSAPLLDPSSPWVDLSREYAYPPRLQWLRLAGKASLVSLPLSIAISYSSLAVKSSILARAAAWTRIIFLMCGIAYLVSHCCACCQRPTTPFAQALPLSREEFRSLVGRENCIWISIILFVAVTLFQLSKDGFLGATLFVGTWLASVLIILPAWWCMNRVACEPIRFGVVVAMFWTGAIFATSMAALTNSLFISFFFKMDPNCNALFPVGIEWPFGPPTQNCVAKAWAQWIFSPGLVEEGFKVMCLLRLCTSLQEAAESKCLQRCPRSSERSWCVTCGWFLKLAPSPASVVLCGMAVGGGFSSVENIKYDFQAGDVSIALLRLVSASMHICMTGVSAVFFAHALFLEPKQRWWMKYIGVLAMGIFHGSFDGTAMFSSPLPKSMCFTRMFGGKLAFCYTSASASFLAGMEASQDHSLLSHISHRRLAGMLQDQSRGFGVKSSIIDLGHCSTVDTHFVCGPTRVSWFPAWPAYAIMGIILLHFVFICSAVPQMEREFRRKREMMPTD